LIVLDIRTFIKAYRITVVVAQNKDMMVKIFAVLFSAELSKTKRLQQDLMFIFHFQI